VDVSLYPDIIEKGGLARALADSARAEGIDLGRLMASARSDGYTSVGLESDRGRIVVEIGVNRRMFVVSISNGIIAWAQGSTPNLGEVARVAQSWQAGATLRGLRERCPFMYYSRLAQGYEDGNPIEVQWDVLLTDPDQDLIRPVLAAAQADERLGRLFPIVSHFTSARFLVDHMDRSAGYVSIDLIGDGYQVDSTWVEEPVRVGTLDDAIAAAVTQLP